MSLVLDCAPCSVYASHLSISLGDNLVRQTLCTKCVRMILLSLLTICLSNLIIGSVAGTAKHIVWVRLDLRLHTFCGYTTSTALPLKN